MNKTFYVRYVYMDIKDTATIECRTKEQAIQILSARYTNAAELLRIKSIRSK